MGEKSSITIRIDNEHLEFLVTLADIEGKTLADEICTAVEKYISLRTNGAAEISAKVAEIKKRRDLPAM